MIFQVEYSYMQSKSSGGFPHQVTATKFVDAESGEELQKKIEEIFADSNCGYRTQYRLIDVKRL